MSSWFFITAVRHLRFVVLLLLLFSSILAAQQPERPGGAGGDPADMPRDLTGKSVKCPRVRMVHSEDPSKEGASAYFLFRDPWVGYARGRELFLREFSAADGAFGESGKLAGPTLDDGVTKQASRDHVNSCMMCHNVPFRDAGAGVTIPKNGGTGRNTPHLFGAGLVEMLGWQLRLQLLSLADKNRDGWIAKDEARGVRAIVWSNGVMEYWSHEKRKTPTLHHSNTPSLHCYAVDFGRFDDANGDDKPDLNPALFIIYVDNKGKRVPWARSFNYEDVAGYTFEVQVFGHGHRARTPVTSTLRAFSAQAFDIHSGLLAHGPTLSEEPNEDGLARVSLAGAPQFITNVPRDRGNVLTPGGVSLDDPDRDGHYEEISEGDLDLIEWYLLNHPAPAGLRRTPQTARGETLFHKIGCARCHVPDWQLLAADMKNPDYTKRYLGDRRFFNLEVTAGKDGQLRGKVQVIATELHSVAENGRSLTPAIACDGVQLRRNRLYIPRRKSFTIRGVFSDFKYHDLGTAFHQIQYDGSTLTHFRTALLWGVGSTAPYGHDGASLTLDAVIRRHGGEAQHEAYAYRRLSIRDREAVVAFLNSLVLYSTDDLPCDVNGDGKISEHFIVAGADTGREVFNPEWLFNLPCRIEGRVIAPDGRRILSRAVVNCREAYGLNLPYCRDKDVDGFPDVLGPVNPQQP